MANILDQYGIKEVADVTLYDITGGAAAAFPVLFLDTLKVSTIEQTASQADAKGGKGNSPLIIWDFGKEITLTLEDALFTPKSMHIMFGGSSSTLASATATVTKMKFISQIDAAAYTAPTAATVTYFAAADMASITAKPTNLAFYAQETYSAAQAYVIKVTAANFPGTYKLVGETYARKRDGGADESFQFIVHQAKMGAENNITLQAEGDPSVFSMKMRVLRPANGVMMELVKYTI